MLTRQLAPFVIAGLFASSAYPVWAQQNPTLIQQESVESGVRLRFQREPNAILRVVGEDGRSFIAKDGDQWNRRRLSIMEAMQSVMGPWRRSEGQGPPSYDVIEEVDCGEYVRQKIRYQSEPNCVTPAYLCIPKAVWLDRTHKVPAILCLHPTDNRVGPGVVVGLGGRPNRQYASELAARGYVTIAPNYPLLAEYQPDVRGLGWESGTMKAIWDNMRAIDLLQSLPMVDGQRIGAIGHSLGGHNSLYTSVFDDRIDAVVTSCGFDSYRDYYDGDPNVWQSGKGWTQLRYMPRMAHYQGKLDQIPFDFDEVLAAIAPRPILAIAPLHDSNFRYQSVDRVVTEARKVYALYGAADQITVLHPDCGHDFPIAMREAAYELFDRTFKRRLEDDGTDGGR